MTISAEREADSPWVKAALMLVLFSDDNDLDVVAQIPPGATITYTIVVARDRSARL